MSKYGVCSGPYFSSFGLNTERYYGISPYSVRLGENTDQKTSYLDTFYAVNNINNKKNQKTKVNDSYSGFNKIINIISGIRKGSILDLSRVNESKSGHVHYKVLVHIY